MGTKSRRWICIALLFALVLGGCETVKEHKETAVGAGVGAGVGAVIGGVTKGTKGAVIGGLLGALAGGAVGAYIEYRDKDSEETKDDLDYDPSEGVRVEALDVTPTPSSVAPGDEVKLKARYAVMTPDDRSVEVTERRQITYRGETVGDTSVTVDRIPGTYTSEVSIRLPRNAKSGDYEVVFTASTNKSSSQSRDKFEVK